MRTRKFLFWENISTKISTKNLDVEERLVNIKQRGYTFSVDIEKAYDFVDRNYLTLCLQEYQFGPLFFKWFVVLNENYSAKFNNY